MDRDRFVFRTGRQFPFWSRCGASVGRGWSVFEAISGFLVAIVEDGVQVRGVRRDVRGRKGDDHRLTERRERVILAVGLAVAVFGHEPEMVCLA